MERPVIFLGFANDDDDYLSHLQAEQEGIKDALWSYESDGTIEIQGQVNMTIDKVFSYFKSEYYKDRIKVFHYSGHANSEQWRLKDYPATISGMAPFFANVDLVVLNGCATRNQADEFINCGVKAVIAARSEIPDRESKIFAIELYCNLANGKTLEVAFDTAVQKIRTIRNPLQPIQSDKRSMRPSVQTDENAEACFWELVYKNKDIKSWTLADVGNFDASWLHMEEEEKEIKDLELRLMRFGSFENCRSQLNIKLKSINEAPAGVLIVSGDRDNGQKWVAGNLLRDSVSFVGENKKQPLNVMFSMETSSESIYFWKQAREWLGGSGDVVIESNLKEETLFLGTRLITHLKTQPVVIRVYNCLENSLFSSIMTDLIEYFWKPFFRGFCNYITDKPSINFYPIVLLIVDEEKELNLGEFISSELRVDELPKNALVTKSSIEAWLKWETDNPALSAVIEPVINSWTKGRECMEHFTGDNDANVVGNFFQRVCDELQFKVDDNCSDENRLVYLKKNKSINGVPTSSPDMQSIDYFR